ncbi:alpha/beta hydrolase [Candidatus Saccharibacteria bacterium]|nr:alpha/beta hydrolase [Candidatus Saccharibacteria bacterium]
MADYLLPLNINGLAGRMLKLPAPKGKNREILFVYGHHTSLERIYGVAELLNKYGAVTVPDLPGFGGMQTFYKIGQQPDLDAMADYLAAFVKLRYRNKRLTIGAYSLGVMIVIRMLQKYPELAKKIDLLASIAGFAHKDDFIFKRRTIWIFRIGTALFSRRLPAAFLKYFIFRKIFIRTTYLFVERFFIKQQHSKIQGTDAEEKRRRIDFEIHLWKCNDPRTYMKIAHEMFTLDLTGKHINLEVYHVSVDADRYFNNTLVEQHMRTIFRDFHLIKADVPSHSPSVIADAKDAAPFIPPALRKVLNAKK